MSFERSSVTETGVGLPELGALLRPHIFSATIMLVAGMLVGLVIAIGSTPTYVARSRILLGRDLPVSQGTESPAFQMSLDTPQIESQINVIQSEMISRGVVKELGLTDDPELGAGDDWRTSLKQLIGLGGAADEIGRTSRVLSNFGDRLQVRRVGQSYVLEISFWSTSPEKAARVANSVTAAYIRDQLRARADAAENGEVIEKKIRLLRDQVSVASEAVRSGVIDVDRFPSASARVLTAATPPFGKSWPNTALLVVFFGMVFFFLGMLAPLFRKSSRKLA